MLLIPTFKIKEIKTTVPTVLGPFKNYYSEKQEIAKSIAYCLEVSAMTA